jgi:hypothetical protein
MKKFLRVVGVAIRVVGVVILLIPLFFAGYLLFPVKFALTQKNLDALKKPYFLVEWTQVTGSSWEIVGDQHGRYDKAIYIIEHRDIPYMIKNSTYKTEYIVGSGETPSIVRNYNFAIGENTYICYGNYVGEIGIGNSKKFSEYQFTDWDILYPVKRDGIIPFLPKSYICKLDFIDEIIEKCGLLTSLNNYIITFVGSIIVSLMP